MPSAYAPGINVLLEEHPDWLKGLRVGLVAHPASVDASGCPSPERLREKIGTRLVALFGPEHGFAGRAGAGEPVGAALHPDWGIPVHSLYGATRRPTPEMLAELDVIVFDLQDLGARPYTYVSTLRYVLEAAAENDKAVIVADRPVPLPQAVDGPLPKPGFDSFVAMIPAPVAYGMTPGETALWLRATLGLHVYLRVAPLRGYRRDAFTGGWMPWIAPSPAIRSWACAAGFPATVFFEALPAFDHARRTEQAFQRVGAPGLDAAEACRRLDALGLPGARFRPVAYDPLAGACAGRMIPGVELQLTDPAVFQPARTGVALICVLQALCGAAMLWEHPDARPAFFDQLMGTDVVRRMIQAGAAPDAIAAVWEPEITAFQKLRHRFLIYD